MTNKKFKQHSRNKRCDTPLDVESFMKALARRIEQEHFMKLVHALDPLVNACEAVEAQIKRPAIN